MGAPEINQAEEAVRSLQAGGFEATDRSDEESGSTVTLVKNDTTVSVAWETTQVIDEDA